LARTKRNSIHQSWIQACWALEIT